jgi:hypothetical protein
MTHTRKIATLALVTAAACGGERERAQAGASSGASAGATAAPMAGMQHGTSTAAASADPMAAHMARMDALPADSLAAVLPEHRQQVANMIARMNREMKDMNMAAT